MDLENLMTNKSNYRPMTMEVEKTTKLLVNQNENKIALMMSDDFHCLSTIPKYSEDEKKIIRLSFESFFF